MAHNHKSDVSAFNGYRNATPSFQVLIRTSAGYYTHRKRRCILITLVLTFLGFTAILIATLFYTLVLHDLISITSANSSHNRINKTDFNEHRRPVHTFSDSAIHGDQCPKITKMGENDQITILFGGINEHGAHVDSIELLPNINCSSLPRLCSISYNMT